MQCRSGSSVCPGCAGVGEVLLPCRRPRWAAGRSGSDHHALNKPAWRRIEWSELAPAFLSCGHGARGREDRVRMKMLLICCLSSAIPALWCGAGWRWFDIEMKLPRRKTESRCRAAARSNKCPYAFSGSLVLALMLSLLAGRGGEGEGWLCEVNLGAGEGRDLGDTAIGRRISVACSWPSTLLASSPVLRQAFFNLHRRPSGVLVVARLSHPDSSGFVPDSCVGGR